MSVFPLLILLVPIRHHKLLQERKKEQTHELSDAGKECRNSAFARRRVGATSILVIRTGSQESAPLIGQALQGIYANIPFGRLRHSPPTPKSGKEAQKVSKQFSRHAFNSASSPACFLLQCFQLLWHSRYPDPSPANSSAAPCQTYGINQCACEGMLTA